MKKLFILLTMALMIPACTLADGPNYEVTIHVVYNSVSYDKAANIIRDAQKQHGEACKVEIQSKKVSASDDEYATLDSTSSIQFTGNYAFGDPGQARIACGDAGIKKSEDGEYYECKD